MPPPRTRDLDIVFEDSWLIVVNKPAGLLSVPLERKAAAPSALDLVQRYLRPFGKLTMKELELQITETEVLLAECQEQFGAAESLKNPSRGQKLQTEYDQLAKKLKQLEAEYFAREN